MFFIPNFKKNQEKFEYEFYLFIYLFLEHTFFLSFFLCFLVESNQLFVCFFTALLFRIIIKKRTIDIYQSFQQIFLKSKAHILWGEAP